MTDIDAIRKRLRQSITTASNDDYSRPGTPERERHAARLDAMDAAIAALDERDRRIAELERIGVPEGHIDFVFDGPPGPQAGRFVEVENHKGESIKFGKWIQRDDGYWVLRCAAAPSPPVGETAPSATETLSKLRADGWMVAIHNDYTLDGETFTFWLFTHPEGAWAKGEGRTDEEALDWAYLRAQAFLGKST